MEEELRYKLPFTAFPSTLVGRHWFLYAGRVLTPFPQNLASTDPGLNAEGTHSHCTQKPDLSGFKWDFWPVEKRYYLLFQRRTTMQEMAVVWHRSRPFKASHPNWERNKSISLLLWQERTVEIHDGFLIRIKESQTLFITVFVQVLWEDERVSKEE